MKRNLTILIPFVSLLTFNIGFSDIVVKNIKVVNLLQDNFSVLSYDINGSGVQWGTIPAFQGHLLQYQLTFYTGVVTGYQTVVMGDSTSAKLGNCTLVTQASGNYNYYDDNIILDSRDSYCVGYNSVNQQPISLYVVQDGSKFKQNKYQDILVYIV